MAFHMRFPALRKGPLKNDPRNIRQTYSLIKPMNNDADELFFYDAQLSFFVTGTDDKHWTSYCLVDTYMGSEEATETYFQAGADGPSGGGDCSDSRHYRNPRGYFLRVLSQRIRQMCKEWGNTTSTVMQRLDAYVRSSFQRTITITYLYLGKPLYPFH